MKKYGNVLLIEVAGYAPEGLMELPDGSVVRADKDTTGKRVVCFIVDPENLNLAQVFMKRGQIVQKNNKYYNIIIGPDQLTPAFIDILVEGKIKAGDEVGYLCTPNGEVCLKNGKAAIVPISKLIKSIDGGLLIGVRDKKALVMYDKDTFRELKFDPARVVGLQVTPELQSNLKEGLYKSVRLQMTRKIS